MKNKVALFLIAVLLLSGVYFGAQKYFCSFSAKDQQGPAWTEALQLEYANTLLSKGLARQAAQAFESYLEKARAAKKELAGVAYKLGNAYMDIGEYEQALGSFYKSEMFEPNAAYKEERGTRIVEALEKLGLSSQAKYELQSRTSLNPLPQKQEDAVARIGQRKITQSEIDASLGNSPQWVRDQLATDEGRLRYIRQYVAGEILYDKAKRLGFERNPQIIKAVDEYKKNIAVQALLQREVEQNLKVGADDLVLYYKANRERFLLPEKIKLAYREFTNKDKEEDLVAALKAGKGLRPEQWVEKGSLLIPDIGEAPEALSRLFKQEKGSVSGPLKIKDKTFIFFIEDKHPERQLSFEEVKNQVENEYRNKKQQDIINNVISKSLEQQEVEILFKPGKEK